ncbi:MAG: DUF2892 domain-containing protein [Candidatus Thalassarchaeaceae archaeon]|nr:MAG: DUF2892 domain-containing protein [Euryarchaeota archaeon]RPG74436.1 MAG: DUF2892 domain-containing protein [Euryarchaeota archaeon TMED85]|tara:strand:+ start:7006 stop:7245 length:240 start_codon:yes stop_codon:yes gene_type:complete
MSNVGRLDRILRGSAGTSVAFVELSGIFGAAELIIEIFALGLAIFLTITSVMGYCPFYPLLRVNTCKIDTSINLIENTH